jgi:3-oxoacyl-[acyl-carrier-protein] synthase-3
MAANAVIIGCGAYLPAKVITNDDLAARMDTNDEWIRTRSGITQRHIAADDETTSTLAIHAAKAALADAGLAAHEIDLIIVATTTPDLTYPSTATIVQGALHTSGAAFDVQAVCAGFVYGLSIANALLQTGQHRNALVIGAETMSRITDWEDRGTAVLFGDGAGAVVIQRQDGESTRGILGSSLQSDGSLTDILKTSGGVSSTQCAGFTKMSGREVFKHATINMADCINELCTRLNISVHDLDLLVPHQANSRIMSAVAGRLGIDEARVVSTVQWHANTSAASIPLALDVAKKEGKLQPGALVGLTALGGGLAWGSMIIRW